MMLMTVLVAAGAAFDTAQACSPPPPQEFVFLEGTTEPKDVSRFEQFVAGFTSYKASSGVDPITLRWIADRSKPAEVELSRLRAEMVSRRLVEAGVPLRVIRYRPEEPSGGVWNVADDDPAPLHDRLMILMPFGGCPF